MVPLTEQPTPEPIKVMVREPLVKAMVAQQVVVVVVKATCPVMLMVQPLQLQAGNQLVVHLRLVQVRLVHLPKKLCA